jgi:hypothetical protein
VRQGLRTVRASRLHSVGLLCVCDQPDAQTSTCQHTTLIRDRHPCPQRALNPKPQQARCHWDRLVSRLPKQDTYFNNTDFITGEVTLLGGHRQPSSSQTLAVSSTFNGAPCLPTHNHILFYVCMRMRQQLTKSVHINIAVIWDITPRNLVLEERRHRPPPSCLLHWRLSRWFLWNVGTHLPDYTESHPRRSLSC